MSCPFCSLPTSRITDRCEAGFVAPDLYPVGKGHTLVIPSRHVRSVYDLSQDEISALWNLVARVRSRLAAELEPDGFTIGVNDGIAAGQTIDHAHIHVVPRFTGDVPDPRGGIRWVIPPRAAYWES